MTIKSCSKIYITQIPKTYFFCLEFEKKIKLGQKNLLCHKFRFFSLEFIWHHYSKFYKSFFQSVFQSFQSRIFTFDQYWKRKPYNFLNTYLTDEISAYVPPWRLLSWKENLYLIMWGIKFYEIIEVCIFVQMPPFRWAWL